MDEAGAHLPCSQWRPDSQRSPSRPSRRGGRGGEAFIPQLDASQPGGGAPTGLVYGDVTKIQAAVRTQAGARLYSPARQGEDAYRLSNDGSRTGYTRPRPHRRRADYSDCHHGPSYSPQTELVFPGENPS